MQKIELGYTQKLNLLDDKSIDRAVEHLKVIRTTSQMSVLVNDAESYSPKYPIQWSDWVVVLQKTLSWMLIKPKTRLPMVAVGIALVCRTKSPSFDAWNKVWFDELRSCFNEQIPEKSNISGRHALFSLLHLVLGTDQDVSVQRAFSLIEPFYHADITERARLWMVSGSLNLPEWVKESSVGWFSEQAGMTNSRLSLLDNFKFNNINAMTLESCYLDFANWNLVLERIEKNLEHGKNVDAFTLYRLVDRINAEPGWLDDSEISRKSKPLMIILDEYGYYFNAFFNAGARQGKSVRPSLANLGYTLAHQQSLNMHSQAKHQLSGYMGSFFMSNQGQIKNQQPSVGVHQYWNDFSVCPIAVNEKRQPVLLKKSNWWNKKPWDSESFQSKNELMAELNNLTEGVNSWANADSTKMDINAGQRMKDASVSLVDFGLYNERSKKKMFKYLFGNSNTEEIVLWLEMLPSSEKSFRSSIESQLLSMGLSNENRVGPPFEMFQLKGSEVNRGPQQSGSMKEKENSVPISKNDLKIDENGASVCNIEVVKKKTIVL